MTQRRQRRSLLGTPQPVQRSRAPRASVVAREEAPPVPMHLKVEVFEEMDHPEPTIEEVFNDMPPDPGLVHVDLAVHELAELPMEAIDDLEEIEEIETLELQDLDEQDEVTQEAPRHQAPPPSVQALPSKLTLDPGPIPKAPSKRDTIYTKMISAFLGAMVATLLLTLMPWWLFVSPRLQAAREAARDRNGPQIVEVPKPVVVERLVPMPTPVPVQAAEVEPEAEVVAAKPVPVKRAVPRNKVRARPRARKPTPKPKAAPAPVAPKSFVTPEPVAPPPPPKPKAVVPDAAKALNGKVRGKAGGDSFYADVIHKTNGRAIVHVKRGDDPWTTARGSYTVSGTSTTLSIAEPGADGAKYKITLSGSSANGTITLPNGKQKSVKAGR